MWLLFLSGVVYGLMAGLSPGPILTLVIAHTLNYDRREGLKIALVPLITDTPLIILSVVIVNSLSDFNIVLAILSFIGAAVMLYLAYNMLQTPPPNARNLQTIKPQSIRKGIMANLFSPAPYVFWLTIGAPILLKAKDIHLLAPLIFLLGMYGFMVGSKMMVATLINRSKQFLKSHWYRVINILLSLSLAGFAVWFVLEGLKLLK